MNRHTSQDPRITRKWMRHCWKSAALAALLILPVPPCARAAVEVICCEVRVSEAPQVRSQDVKACAAHPVGREIDLALQVGGESFAKFPGGTSAAAQHSADALMQVVRETGRILRDWISGNNEDKPRVKGSRNADCCGSS
jgi:hypothetical protein